MNVITTSNNNNVDNDLTLINTNDNTSYPIEIITHIVASKSNKLSKAGNIFRYTTFYIPDIRYPKDCIRKVLSMETIQQSEDWNYVEIIVIDRVRMKSLHYNIDNHNNLVFQEKRMNIYKPTMKIMGI